MSCARTGTLLARLAAEKGSGRAVNYALRGEQCLYARAVSHAGQQRSLFVQSQRDLRPVAPPLSTTRLCSSNNDSSSNGGGKGKGENTEADGAPVVAEEAVEQQNADTAAESSPSDGETVVDGATHDPHMYGLTKVSIPDIFPNVPVLCVSRTPIFPRFVKTMLLRDQRVIDLLVRKCKLSQPYVGIFLRRDDNNPSEVISSLDDVHPVGVFAQVVELHNIKGGQTSVLLAAHRRIRITGEYVEDIPMDSAMAPRRTAGETVDSKQVDDFEITLEFKPGSPPQESSATTDVETDKEAEATDAKEETTTPAELPPIDDPPPLPPPSVVEAPPFSFLTRVRGPFGGLPASKGKADAGATGAEAPGAAGEAEEEKTPPHISMVVTENVYHEPYKRDVMLKALSGEVLNTMREIVINSPVYRDTLSQVIADGKFVVGDNPAHLADFGAALTNADSKKLFEVLEERSIHKRLQLSLALLKQQLEVCNLQKKLATDVDAKVTEAQRNHHLHEQLKIIKKELGMEKDNKEALAEKFKARLENLTVPEEVQSVIDEELSKISFLDENSSEFNVTRNYLDWLTAIKWGQYTDENFEIARAKTILDEDHYGMKPIKERILEFIAVGQLQGSVQGKILFFVGPPGVGKTSIAKSIARSLNRKYFRFSVGGMSDVAEIKGHRRTYVGAMPGKLIQCLKKTEACNPVVVIDEVDKMAHKSIHGDPQSALLEVLDPEQNSSFLDHYLDVPVDLSKILFICTGNSIPAEFSSALLDRMEVIEVSGYMSHEKTEIAKRYLVPKARESTGIAEEQTQIDDEVINALIRSYCRESGVRGLQKQIEKIYRKAAFKIVESLPSKKEVVQVSSENLADFVGKPIFMSDRLYDLTPPGVVMGLSWTSSGGAPLYLEVTNRYRGTKDSQGSLIATGSLGKVLTESASIAYSYARVYAMQHFPKKIDPLVLSTLHLHCPQGAVPKDGPSAGIAIVSALLSLALHHPVRQQTAMTGEVSLQGKVLRVGGIKEKVLGARRAGVTCIVLPEENRCDWEELDEVLRNGIQVHFVTHYAQVFPILFEGWVNTPPSIQPQAKATDGSVENESVTTATTATTTATVTKPSPSDGGVSFWRRLFRPSSSVPDKNS